MGFGNYRNRVLLAVLLIAAVISSCKSPTTPSNPQAMGPTLALILPDSARMFDTVIFKAHYSDSIKPTWKFLWQFGDSSRGISADTSIGHSYSSSGTYRVQVALIDPSGSTIATQSGQLRVVPNHFDTSLLHTFRSVTIQCYGFYEAQWWGENQCVDYSDSAQLSDSLFASFSSLVWADSGTFQNSSGSDSTSYQPKSFNTWRTIFTCTLDSALTTIQSINGDQFYHNWDADNFSIGNGSEVDFSASNIYFKSSSDTDMVFESIGISNAQANNWWSNQPYPRCLEWQQGSGKIDFSNSSVSRRVVIRFHN